MFITGVVFLFTLSATAEARRSSSASRKPQSSNSASDATAWNRILQAEDSRITGDKRLLALFGHPSRRIAKAAILAAGRNRDGSYLEPLANLLNRKDKELKQLAAFSLGMIGTELSLKILQQHLAMQKDGETIVAILNALGISASDKALNTVAPFLKAGNSIDVMEAACEAMGKIFTTLGTTVPPNVQDILKDLGTLAAGGEPVARSASFALSRWKNEISSVPAASLITAARKTNWPETRELLLRTLGRFKTAEVSLYLASELANSAGNPGARIEAAKALSTHPASETVFAALKTALEDGSGHLIYQVLETIYNMGAAAGPRLSEQVDNIIKVETSVWKRGAALKTLAAINPTLARTRLNEILPQAGPPLLEACIGSLGVLGGTEDLEKVLTYLTHTKTSVIQASLEALSQTPEEKYPATTKPLLRKTLEKGDLGISALISQIVEKNRWKDFAVPLSLTYRLHLAADQVEARVAILSALAVVGDPSQLDVVEEAFKDNEKVVVEAAAKAKKALTGNDESSRIPLNSKVTRPATTNYNDIKPTGGKALLLKTTKGDITIKFFDETPLVNFEIMKLVKNGFFTEKTFHRVVPNFVVQGGDPRGDGFGGPGYLIRDQYSLVSPERGLVGLATAGQDTGGSQIFFNLAPNLHLRGRYTFFGEVTAGHEVLDRLEVDDKILQAKLK